MLTKIRVSKKKAKTCLHFFQELCCRELESARVWDCYPFKKKINLNYLCFVNILKKRIIMNKRRLIHAVAYCRDCKWEETYYTCAVRKARYHAKKTGHTIDIETGYYQTLNPKEIKLAIDNPRIVFRTKTNDDRNYFKEV